MRQVSLLLWSWIETIRSLPSGRLWGPFLGFALVQWAIILLLTQFHRTGLSFWMVPLIGSPLIAGEGALHYPNFFLALPSIYARLSLVIDLVVGAWLMGCAYLLFWHAEHPTERAPGALRQATKNWGRLLFARLPVVLGLLLVVFFLPRLFLEDPGTAGGNTLRAIRYGTILVGSMVEALLLYAPLAVLVEGKGPFGAIRRSIGIAIRWPIASLGAVLVPNLVQIPGSYLMRNSERVVRTLTPDLVAWIVCLAIAIYVFAAFFTIGAATRLYRVKSGEADGWEDQR